MNTPTRNPRPVTIDQQEPIFNIGRMALDLDGDTLRYLLLRGWTMWRDNRTQFELRNYQMCEDGYIYATRAPRSGISDRQWIGTGTDMLLIHIEDAKKFNPRGYTDAMLGDEREVTVPLGPRFEYDSKSNTIIDRKYTPRQPQTGHDVFIPIHASFKYEEGSKVALRQKNSAERKGEPIYSGALMYFPDALAAVARLSLKANEKHNPGEPMHWSRGKSTDQMDCATRHSLTPNTVDPETGEAELVQSAWRILAELQLAEEKRLRAAGIMPYSGVTQ